MKVSKRWFVIVDGARARFVERDQEGRFRTVSSFEATSMHMRSRDIGRDRPGRVYESADTGRHGTEPRHDPHETEKRKFVALVIDEIEVALKQGCFDEFVLVAPPKVLGQVRQTLPATLAEVLADTLSKDLTKTPDHELPEHLLD
ncbi:MAG: host attachment protein [Candidatus Promineifilaceae bacterium]|jgi:protein required for attachment to host cells